MSKVLRTTLSVVWVGAMSLGGRSCCSPSCAIDLSTHATQWEGQPCTFSDECYSRRCIDRLCVSATCGFQGEPCCAEGCHGSSYCNDARNVCDPCGGLFGPACPRDAGPVVVDGGDVPCGTLNEPCCSGANACARPLNCMTVATAPDASDDTGDATDAEDGADVDAGGGDAGDAGDHAGDAAEVGIDVSDARLDADAIEAAFDDGDAKPADTSDDADGAPADGPGDATSELPVMLLRVCLACGGDGYPCCGRRCAEHLACERDDAGVAMCGPCGLRGEPCCAGARCEFGARCAPLDDGFERCVPTGGDGGGDAPDEDAAGALDDARDD